MSCVRIKETSATIDRFPVPAAALAQLIRAVADGQLDSSRAHDVFAQMFATGQDVAAATQALGIKSVDDQAIVALCRSLLQANPRIVDDIRAGKQQAVGALVGQAKKQDPNVNPAQVRQICLQLIEQP